MPGFFNQIKFPVDPDTVGKINSCGFYVPMGQPGIPLSLHPMRGSCHYPKANRVISGLVVTWPDIVNRDADFGRLRCFLIAVAIVRGHMDSMMSLYTRGTPNVHRKFLDTYYSYLQPTLTGPKVLLLYINGG